MDVYLQSETWSSRHTAHRHAGTYLTRPVPTTTQSDLTRGRGHLPSLRATPGTGAAHNSRPRRPVVWIMPRTIRWFEAHVFTVVVTVPASLSSSPAMPCLDISSSSEASVQVCSRHSRCFIRLADVVQLRADVGVVRE